MREQVGTRRATVADHRAWQLLDGQQRINALFSIFTAQGKYGRFLLNMTAPRQPPGPPPATRLLRCRCRRRAPPARQALAHRRDPLGGRQERHDRPIRLTGTTQPVAVSRYDLTREDQEGLPSEDALVTAFRAELTESKQGRDGTGALLQHDKHWSEVSLRSRPDRHMPHPAQ